MNGQNFKELLFFQLGLIKKYGWLYFIRSSLVMVYSFLLFRQLAPPLHVKLSSINQKDDFKRLKKIILNPKPFMIGRIGGERALLTSYILQHKYHNFPQRLLAILRNGFTVDPCYLDKVGIFNACHHHGFFPSDDKNIHKLLDMLVEDYKQTDIMCVFSPRLFETQSLFEQAPTMAHGINPLFNMDFNWLQFLAAKKVLVVHVFADSIKKQYLKRQKLFSKKDYLPEFQLQAIPAVQSVAGNKTPFASWFKALEHTKNEIDKCDYDIALIGAGLYSNSLAAHVKRKGKTAICLGSLIQLIFGIKGKIIDKQNAFRYDHIDFDPRLNIPNEFWVHPASTERPKNYLQIEGGMYW